MTNRTDTTTKLEALRSLLRGKSEMLLVLQSNPDPDALASAMALRALANGWGLSCSLACGGTVGRAENRALVRYTKINVRSMDDVNVDRFDVVALVDAQPGQSNSSLPEGRVPDVIIDHHPARPESRRAAFTDIRSRWGATSTILLEYQIGRAHV